MLDVICGFPGIGKTYYAKKYGVFDSDSSKFSKDGFPRNYIEYIKSLNGTVLVSTHREVRDMLADEDISFALVYPSMECKEEYVERYKDRGSPASFIELLKNNWEVWVKEMIKEDRAYLHFVLGPGKFLSDVRSEF